MLAGKHIIIGISGGIAAYKSLYLIRLLKKAGAEVKVVCTPNALEFVTRLTIETLSQNKLYSNVFGENDFSTEHIALSDWGDAFIIAPATANIIGKFAHAIADDALSTTFLAFNKKVFLAPAMNTKMYQNPAVKDSMQLLKERGNLLIEPAEGMLACGYEGKGRMEEPEILFKALEDYFSTEDRFNGKKVLITAGPTVEAIDPVRYISNHSSGYMGYALANEFAKQGALVTLISGPVANPLKIEASVKLVPVVSAIEMHDEAIKTFKTADICIMAAAVADYMPKNIAKSKIKKDTGSKNIELTPTPDILKELGQIKKNKQLLVGFALETDNEIENATKKLQNKNLDCVVLNSLNDQGAGFATSTNKITIINNDLSQKAFPLKQKSEVANDIVEYIFSNFIQHK